jgi:uncharacterized protein
MGRHAEYWAGVMPAGKVVFYGPVTDGSGAWGLAVLEADSEAEARALVEADPAISSGMGTYEIGVMPVTILRRSAPAGESDRELPAGRARLRPAAVWSVSQTVSLPVVLWASCRRWLAAVWSVWQTVSLPLTFASPPRHRRGTANRCSAAEPAL